MKRHHYIPAWLAILTLIFNGFGQMGIVLCIGLDGHLAIESVCEENLARSEVSCCPDEHDDHDSSSAIEHDQCGDCTDLLLARNIQHSRSCSQRFMVELSTPPVMLLDWPLASVCRFASTKSPPLIRDLPPPSGLTLRTVMLRI